ncbi:hypothetical protein HYPSUDRAFT_207298 [Hypholoma sublateritium FD-334 SS-4]|uniref:Uncharacterized protein n=1 Tax=Hypholoma sublateritium (strain FD-334 SS-4) TaxID=945553 RepID=A0A0D2LZ32_HYPSF|nr:hypothetical protein HYPSUDRAFT_207298 [Hypholoma sublateritium FD-334 SS-4]
MTGSSLESGAREKLVWSQRDAARRGGDDVLLLVDERTRPLHLSTRNHSPTRHFRRVLHPRSLSSPASLRNLPTGVSLGKLCAAHPSTSACPPLHLCVPTLHLCVAHLTPHHLRIHAHSGEHPRDPRAERRHAPLWAHWRTSTPPRQPHCTRSTSASSR